jgi:hypothetical protein
LLAHLSGFPLVNECDRHLDASALLGDVRVDRNRRDTTVLGVQRW